MAFLLSRARYRAATGYRSRLRVSKYPFGQGATVFGILVDRPWRYSIHKAAAAHNLTYQTVRSVLRATGHIKKGARSPTVGLTYLDPIAIDPLLRRVSEGIYARDGAVHLSMPRFHFLLLARAGLIPPIVPGPGVAVVYHPEDLDHFEARLMARARVVTEKPKGCVAMVKLLGAKHYGIARTVSLILDGKLTWVGRDPAKKGYASLLLLEHEVRAALDPSVERTDNVYARARELGLKAQSVNALVMLGYLQVTIETRPNGKRVRFMTDEQLLELRSNYATFKDLGKTKGARTRAHFALMKRGIQPLADARARNEIIYRRSDLT